ncbi:MAG: DUF6249 domain-containing protein [Pseudoflavonifractor sp.]|nr:DUF6249 domain-containing protein [Pseudoflavonifractor sp.]
MKMFIRLFVIAAAVAAAVGLTACGSDADGKGRVIGESVGAALRDINVSDTVFRLDTEDCDEALSTVVTVSRDSTLLAGPLGSGIVVNVYEDSGSGGFDGGDILPIVAVVCCFACPIFIVLLIMIYIYKIYRSRNRVIEKAVESGAVVTPELLYLNRSPRRYLNQAMTWLGLGLGVLAMAWIIGSSGLMGVGCVPTFIGLGKMVTYLLEDRKNGCDTENQAEEDAEQD